MMLDILDIDEATVVSEIRMAQMQAEFEAQFNAPLAQMQAMQMTNDQFSMNNAGGQDGTN